VQEFVQEWRPACHPSVSVAKSQIARFTWENSVELMFGEKQRNRENFNFKSAASVALILAQILVQAAVSQSKSTASGAGRARLTLGPL
jgi:hypothetical protein